MPPEGAPAVLRDRIAQGRAAVVEQLDEAARLLLTDARRYPPERLIAHAGWLLGELKGGER